MKILIVTNSYLPKISGVAEIINEFYARLLASQSGLEVRLICAHYKDSPASQNINGIQVRRYRNLALSNQRVDLPSLDMLGLVWKEIKDFKPDQIHLHSRFSTTNLCALIIAKILGIRAVHFEYLADFVSGEKFWIRNCAYFYDQIFSRLTYFLTDQIVATSQSILNFITTLLGASKSKVMVIENASKFKDDGQTFKQKFASPKNQYNIFFAARLVGLKNPLLTLEAILKLRSIRQDFQFLMAGDGKLKVEVEEFIQSNQMGEYVNYLGYLNAGQIKERFGQSDLFLNCSQLEGLPNTVLEAITNTNICLVSDVGGNNDLIQIPELLIPLNELTSERLAEKIDFVLSNTQTLIPQLQTNKDYVIRKFSWENAIQKLEQNVLWSKA
jgi:glycosyltransferase involved in cell wall biosynthesis